MGLEQANRQMDQLGKQNSPAHRQMSADRSLSLRPRPLPELPHKTLQQIDRLAAEIRAASSGIDNLSPFGAGVHKGMGTGPCAWFGDTAEIPLMAQNPLVRFDYRLGWLAQDHDIVVTGGQPFAAFEDYQRGWLNAPNLRYLNVDPEMARPRRATPVICLRDPVAFDALSTALADHNSITLHANLTTGTIWALAARLNQATGADVCVAGPPPQLSRLANDKIWFGDVAQRLLGTGAIPEKRTAYSASALTRHVGELAKDWDQLVVKVPNSAGSAGNFVFRSSDVRGLRPFSLNRHLMHDLSINGWSPVFPVLVEVWDANVLTSPSVQTWIPHPNDGPPIVECSFEQVLRGKNAAFAGAAPAHLPPLVEEELVCGALQLATLFQKLGYYGRCSFDALVTGSNDHERMVHWIECNARWGGASVPMSLVHRLSRGADDLQYVIVQKENDTLCPLDFADAVREFADLAPLPGLKTGVLFLSPNVMAAGTGSHFIAFGDTMTAAEELAQTTLRRLRSAIRPGFQPKSDGMRLFQ